MAPSTLLGYFSRILTELLINFPFYVVENVPKDGRVEEVERSYSVCVRVWIVACIDSWSLGIVTVKSWRCKSTMWHVFRWHSYSMYLIIINVFSFQFVYCLAGVFLQRESMLSLLDAIKGYYLRERNHKTFLSTEALVGLTHAVVMHSRANLSETTFYVLHSTYSWLHSQIRMIITICIGDILFEREITSWFFFIFSYSTVFGVIYNGAK